MKREKFASTKMIHGDLDSVQNTWNTSKIYKWQTYPLQTVSLNTNYYNKNYIYNL
jgi:hypothetical protein